MLQLSELCRLCAIKKKNKLELFEANGQALLIKIFNCLPIQVSREDLLPKMVCSECQRIIEQFNLFRTKCLKAEDKLNKMLARSEHKNIMVTQIKQEYLEPELHENPFAPTNICVDIPRRSEHFPIKPVKKLKSEIADEDDLVQIISEEMVHQQLVDIKEPHIEIIAEGYPGDEKGLDLSELVKKVHINSEHEVDDESRPASSIAIDLFDAEQDIKQVVKVVPPLFVGVDDFKDLLSENKSDVGAAEICEAMPTKNNKRVKRKDIRRKKCLKRDIIESDEELEEKDLLLGENEMCDIDMEAMEAVIKKKLNPNAVFECHKCQRCFKFYKGLKKHRESHVTEPKLINCDVCITNGSKNIQFSTVKCLKDHMRRKHSVLPYHLQCLNCDKRFLTRGQLNVHIKRVHDKSGATCPLCNKTFKNISRLNSHKTVHADERPFVCDQCGQAFKRNTGLKVHIQSRHTQEKNFLCSECGRKFATKKNLVEHLNIHTGVRPYICKYCSASFAQMATYKKHEAQHRTELRVHKCQNCDKAFSHAHMLRLHSARHSLARPYICSVCNNTYKSQSDLWSHSKVHQEKQYECTFCSRKFSRLKTLRDHVVRHTGIKHVCPVPGCGRSYTQRFPLTKHFMKHHPKLSLVNRVGGKKGHMNGKMEDNTQGKNCIDYIFIVKGTTVH